MLRQQPAILAFAFSSAANSDKITITGWKWLLYTHSYTNQRLTLNTRIENCRTRFDLTHGNLWSTLHHWSSLEFFLVYQYALAKENKQRNQILTFATPSLLILNFGKTYLAHTTLYAPIIAQLSLYWILILSTMITIGDMLHRQIQHSAFKTRARTHCIDLNQLSFCSIGFQFVLDIARVYGQAMISTEKHTWYDTKVKQLPFIARMHSVVIFSSFNRHGSFNCTWRTGLVPANIESTVLI